MCLECQYAKMLILMLIQYYRSALFRNLKVCLSLTLKMLWNSSQCWEPQYFWVYFGCLFWKQLNNNEPTIISKPIAANQTKKHFSESCPTLRAHGSPGSFSSILSGHPRFSRGPRASRAAIFTRRARRSGAARCAFHMCWLHLSHEIS